MSDSITPPAPRRRPSSRAKLKAELVCRKCGAAWKYCGAYIQTTCPFCHATKDARDRSGETKPNAEQRKRALCAWYSDPEHRRERQAKDWIIRRKRIFFRITGSITPSCARCGCDDPRLLEVNHRNGGGREELRQNKGTTQFYRDIAAGRRATNDLELLCKPCNAVHALELKFGALPMRVVWDPKGGDQDGD